MFSPIKIQDRLFEKLSRWFGSPEQAIVEALQNAYRSYLTDGLSVPSGVIDVTISGGDLDELGLRRGITLKIVDQGRGIADFGAMLSPAGSAWAQGVEEVHDPAGMGVLALLSHSAQVTWRSNGQALTVDRRYFTEPEYRNGLDRLVETSSVTQGTEVEIAGLLSDTRVIRRTVEHFARWCYGVKLRLSDRTADATAEANEYRVLDSLELVLEQNKDYLQVAVETDQYRAFAIINPSNLRDTCSDPLTPGNSELRHYSILAWPGQAVQWNTEMLSRSTAPLSLSRFPYQILVVPKRFDLLSPELPARTRLIDSPANRRVLNEIQDLLWPKLIEWVDQWLKTKSREIGPLDAKASDELHRQVVRLGDSIDHAWLQERWSWRAARSAEVCQNERYNYSWVHPKQLVHCEDQGPVVDVEVAFIHSDTAIEIRKFNNSLRTLMGFRDPTAEEKDTPAIGSHDEFMHVRSEDQGFLDLAPTHVLALDLRGLEKPSSYIQGEVPRTYLVPRRVAEDAFELSTTHGRLSGNHWVSLLEDEFATQMLEDLKTAPPLLLNWMILAFDDPDNYLSDSGDVRILGAAKLSTDDFNPLIDNYEDMCRNNDVDRSEEGLSPREEMYALYSDALVPWSNLVEISTQLDRVLARLPDGFRVRSGQLIIDFDKSELRVGEQAIKFA